MIEYEKAKAQFSKYASSPFRKFQQEAIQYAVESDRKIVVLEASTGSGKSLIGLTAGAMGGKLIYLVHTKLLQNQITNDFPEAESLFGRNNYPCRRNEDVTCEDCTSTSKQRCDFKKSGCLYETRKKEVLKAKYRILNYSYYLS